MTRAVPRCSRVRRRPFVPDHPNAHSSERPDRGPVGAGIYDKGCSDASDAPDAPDGANVLSQRAAVRWKRPRDAWYEAPEAVHGDRVATLASGSGHWCNENT
jgi:hypothetical protein